MPFLLKIFTQTSKMQPPKEQQINTTVPYEIVE